MRYVVAATVDAPVERVWAWWTDFGEPGQVLRVKHGAGSSTRTILARDERSVAFQDKSALGVIHRVVTLGEGWTFTEVGTGGQTFEATWRFEPEGPARTRVVREMRVRAAPVFRPFATWVTRQDLRYHCREASKELRP
jgi:hypothetical protein